MYKKILAILAIIVVFAVVFQIVSAEPSPQLSTSPLASPNPSPTGNVSATPSVSPSATASGSVSPTPLTSAKPSVKAADESGGDYIDSVLPRTKAIYGETNKSPYLKEWKQNYYVDRIDNIGLLDFIGSDVDPAHLLVNIVFQLQKNLVEIVIALVNMAFNLDFTGWLHSTIEKTIGGMYTNSLRIVIGVIVAAVGFYLAYMMIKQNRAKIFTIIIQTVIVIAIAEYFYTHPIEVMENVDGFVSDVSATVITSVFYDSNSDNKNFDKPEVPVTNIANSIYKEYVHRPWQVLEFGSINRAENKFAGNSSDKNMTNEKAILSTNMSEKRMSAYKDIQGKDKFSTSSTKRLGFMFVYLIPVLVNLAVIIIMCILVMSYKFFLILLIFLGIFVFPLALVPGIGPGIIKEWLVKLFGVACMKIVLVFFLALILQFNEAIFQNASKEGWMMMLFIQTIIYLVIFIKRNTIMEIFALVKKGATNPQSLKGSVGRTFASERPTFMRETIDSYKASKDTTGRAIKRTVGAARNAKGKYKKSIFKIAESGLLGKEMKFVAKTKKLKEAVQSKQYTPEDLKKEYPGAKRHLENKYNYYKNSAERKAKKTDGSPKYNDFVRKAEGHSTVSGGELFDENDVNNAALRYAKAREYLNLRKTFRGKKR